MILHQQFITNWGKILNRYCLVVTMDFYHQHIDDVCAMIEEMKKRIPPDNNKELHQIEVWRKPIEWINEHKDADKQITINEENQRIVVRKYSDDGWYCPTYDYCGVEK